jgi:hypothetical protein
MFGIYLFPNSLTDSQLQLEMNAWKKNGGVYFFAADLLIISADQAPAGWDSFRMRNLNGDYLDLTGANGFYAPLQVRQYSLSSPLFQAALKAAAMHAVDLGADGITFDDPFGQLQVILGVPDASGSFDIVTMAAFQTYLQQNFTASQLMSQFGISDIGSFNYASYIQANNLTPTWNQQPLTGLARQFFIFKRLETLNFLRDLATSTKQYAQQQYGRNFLINANTGDYPIAYFLNDVTDLDYMEFEYLGGGDHPFGAVDIRAFNGWKKPVTVKPLALCGCAGVSDPLSKATTNLERVLIADQAAAMGMAGATVYMNDGPIGEEPVDLSVVDRYASFLLSNPQLMTQTATQAKTLLIQSASSMLGGTLASPAEHNPYSGETDYFGTGRLLLDSGITYDSVFLPDTSYSQLPPLTLGALTPYRAVIAPYTWALDDNQVSVLLNYAQQGGTLIIDGSFANSQPDGTPASRPDVQAILATLGVQPYGSGKIVVTNALYGNQYEAGNMSAQRTVGAAFQSFLAPYVSPDVMITQPPAQIYEPGITPFFYRDANGRALVHLVNYDYDINSDTVYSKTNIQVQVQVGSQPVDVVVPRSPDIAGAQSLPFTRNGGTITLTVPEVDAWDVLYFETSTQAPAVSSTTPAAATGAAAGDSLSFSVQALDADGNPLSYVWSVNGQAVSGVFGPTFSMNLPLTATGIYTVTVQVTDGLRTTQCNWTVNVAAYRKPNVLFDETHNEQDSIEPARASQINPQYPGLALFGALDQALQGNYQVSSLTSGPITSQTLAGVDVLVLAAPEQPLTPSENQAISTFVQGGGGLIFLGVQGEDSSIDSLLSPWGMQFDGALIKSTQNPCCPQAFQLDSFADNAAVGSNPFYWIDWAGSLTVAQPALRANIDETVLPVIISEQGENRDQCEEQRNIFDFSQGFACR